MGQFAVWMASRFSTQLGRILVHNPVKSCFDPEHWKLLFFQVSVSLLQFLRCFDSRVVREAEEQKMLSAMASEPLSQVKPTITNHIRIHCAVFIWNQKFEMAPKDMHIVRR